MRQLGITLFVLVLSLFSPWQAVSRGQVVLEFDDGSRVTARDLLLKNDSCKLMGAESILDAEGKGNSFTVARGKLVAVALQNIASSEQWDKLRNSATNTDRIVIDREGNLDFYPGTVPEISSEKVFFRPVTSAPATKTYSLNRSKIIGVVFAKNAKSTSIAGTAHPSQTGETLVLTNGDILHSTYKTARKLNNRLPWKLANGLTGQVSLDKIKSRQSHQDNIIPLVSIEPTTIQSLPLVESVPSIGTTRPDWKNAGVYLKPTRTEAKLVPPCQIVWPIPPKTVRVEGEFHLANDFQTGEPFPELKLTLLNGENVVFCQSLDARRPRVPFSIPLTKGTTLECRIEFQRGPMPGALVILSADFIAVSPQKSR